MLFVLLDKLCLHNRNNDKMIYIEHLNEKTGLDWSSWAKQNAPVLLEVRALNKTDCADLTSPWATTIAEEMFFDATMTCLAETIDQDNVVSTLFKLLVLISPSLQLLPGIAGHPQLIEIETEEDGKLPLASVTLHYRG